MVENPFTWTTNASLLFLDNPAGVGFSFAGTPQDLHNNDLSTSKDNFFFMEQFYQDWPELLSNPLYIGGNSYGGIYAPFLAYQLHSHN
jgi:carboxypeptidase C (cathepsin A)